MVVLVLFPPRKSQPTVPGRDAGTPHTGCRRTHKLQRMRRSWRLCAPSSRAATWPEDCLEASQRLMMSNASTDAVVERMQSSGTCTDDEDSESSGDDDEDLGLCPIYSENAPLPSLGSVAHGDGTCRRCCFFPKVASIFLKSLIRYK